MRFFFIFFLSNNTVIKLGEGKDLGGCIMSGDRQLKQGKNGRGEHKDHRKDIFRGILTG